MRACCHVTPQGEVVCDDIIVRDPVPIAEAIGLALQTKGVDVPREKLLLIARLALEVLASPLDDACIGWRADDAVGSVNQILAQDAPLMLLFKYSTLPANIMATYFDNKGDFIQLQKVLQEWSKTRSACPPAQSARQGRGSKTAAPKTSVPKSSR